MWTDGTVTIMYNTRTCSWTYNSSIETLHWPSATQTYFEFLPGTFLICSLTHWIIQYLVIYVHCQHSVPMQEVVIPLCNEVYDDVVAVDGGLTCSR